MSDKNFVVEVTRQTFFKETASMSVTAKDEETAVKEVINYVKKHANDGEVKWDREQLSKYPRINLVSCNCTGECSADDAFSGIPDSTATDDQLPEDIDIPDLTESEVE